MMTCIAFVSSTYEDLAEHRQHVIDKLRSSGIHVDPMEDWTAASSAPTALSKQRVVDCDLCVLLVARRRGHVPRGEDRSITQMEYRQAMGLGIDVLPFLLHEEAEWDSGFDEQATDPALTEWRSELSERHTVSKFGKKPESIEVLPAIVRWLQEKPGIDPKRLAALNSVRNITDQVIRAVGHGHDFGNRLDWAKEMDKLGDTYRDVLPDLYMPIQMIAWRIRDHSFDHNQEDSGKYCCDQLVGDLRALQFEVLKVAQKSMAKQEVERLAVEIVSDIELMQHGMTGTVFRTLPSPPEGVSEDSEDFKEYQKALEKSLEENRKLREEERQRLLKRWHDGIEWHQDFAVAAKGAPPSS